MPGPFPPDGTPIGTVRRHSRGRRPLTMAGPFNPDGPAIGTPTIGTPTRPAASAAPAPPKLPAPPAPPAPPKPPADLVAALYGSTELAAYAAAAAAARPWGNTHPIQWAVATGRITAAGAVQWAVDLADNPGVTLPILAALEPILGPQPLAAATAPTANGPGRVDDLAEFVDLFPPGTPHGRQDDTPDAEYAQFDDLYPPGMRYARNDTPDPAFAEFDELFPPGMRYGNKTSGGS